MYSKFCRQGLWKNFGLFVTVSAKNQQYKYFIEMQWVSNCVLQRKFLQDNTSLVKEGPNSKNLLTNKFVNTIRSRQKIFKAILAFRSHNIKSILLCVIIFSQWIWPFCVYARWQQKEKLTQQSIPQFMAIMIMQSFESVQHCIRKLQKFIKHL